MYKSLHNKQTGEPGTGTDFATDLNGVLGQVPIPLPPLPPGNQCFLHLYSMGPSLDEIMVSSSPNCDLISRYSCAFHETLVFPPLTLPIPPTSVFQGSQRPGRTQLCQSWYLSPGLSQRCP